MPVSRRAGLLGPVVLVASLGAPPNAWADEAASPSAEGSPPAAAKPELPEFMRNRRRMFDDDLARKNVGHYVTGLPLVNYDPNTGVGLGARVFYFDNGTRDDPFFEYTPYRHRAFGQGFASTEGFQYHWLDYDGLYLGDSPYRLRAKLIYERNSANYYGVGESTLGPLSFRGRTYDTLAALQKDLSAVDALGVASPLYNKFDLERPNASVTVERDFFHGRVRVQAGVNLSYVSIRTFDGKTVHVAAPGGAGTTEAIQGATLLTLDCERGRILGCNGGWNNTLKLGLVYDSRDFEPDPNLGVFADVTGEVSSPAFGSAHEYARLTLSPRVYYSPFPKLTDLVFAGRLLYSMQTSQTPFYAAGTLALTDGDISGLGGLRTLRGFRQDRFVGLVSALASLEVRWTFTHFQVAKQKLGVMVVPFLESGRVFDKVDLRFENWKTSYGAGLRVAWNQATIIAADYGMSREDAGLYINFGHPF